MCEETRDEVRALAVDNYRNGLNCAESVYDALLRCDALKGVAPETRAMAIGFGGGIGLSGFTCGALSAAVMANGAVHGRPDPWQVDPEVRGHEISEKYYRRYNNMLRDFEKICGGVLCRDICGRFDDWQSKDRRKMCMNLIGETAVLAYDYLLIPQEKAFVIAYGENMGGMK